MKVKAAVLYEVKKPLVIEEIEQDPPKAHEVRIKVKACGVCHSDLHYITGDSPMILPGILGHEVAGVVTEVGPNVTRMKAGDHVIGSFLPNCGFCRYCSAGMPHLCETYRTIRGPLLDGTSRNHNRAGKDLMVMGKLGGFAEQMVAPETGLVPIRKDMPLEPASLIACAVTTGICAVTNRARVEAGSDVAVIGAGGVGLSVIMGAKLVGASKIIAIDILDNKLAWARQFGATHTVNAAREDTVKRVQEMTGGEGVNYSFEAIGNPKTCRQALDMLASHGVAVMVGLPPAGVDLSFEGRAFFFRERAFIGTIHGSARPVVDFPRIVEYYMNKQIKLDEMISKRWRLEQINQAFESLAKGEVARSIIVFD
jgi:Zn-dependent alcohol dehydrogenase